MTKIPLHTFTWQQPLPVQVALAQFGKPVAALMDHAANGYTDAIRALQPTEIKWSVGCIRGPDPAHTTDPEAALRLLVASSRFFLIAKGKDAKLRFSRTEELFTPPQLALEYLRQHSQLICGRRLEEEAAIEGLDLSGEEPAAPFLYERITRPGGNHQAPAVATTDLAAALDQWVKEHPQADRRLIAITRTAITYLVQTGGE